MDPSTDHLDSEGRTRARWSRGADGGLAVFGRPLCRSLGLRRTAKQMAAVRAFHVDPRGRASVGEGLRARGPTHRARRTAWRLIRPGFRFRSLAHGSSRRYSMGRKQAGCIAGPRRTTQPRRAVRRAPQRSHRRVASAPDHGLRRQSVVSAHSPESSGGRPSWLPRYSSLSARVPTGTCPLQCSPEASSSLPQGVVAPDDRTANCELPISLKRTFYVYGSDVGGRTRCPAHRGSACTIRSDRRRAGRRRNKCTLHPGSRGISW
jgi:hypothetical protein